MLFIRITQLDLKQPWWQASPNGCGLHWIWSNGLISVVLNHVMLCNAFPVFCLTNDFPTGYLSFTWKTVLINSLHWICSLQWLNKDRFTATHASYGVIVWHSYESLWSSHIKMRKKGPRFSFKSIMKANDIKWQYANVIEVGLTFSVLSTTAAWFRHTYGLPFLQIF